jgi:hypothetical protein
MRMSGRILVLSAGRLLRRADRERRAELDRQLSGYTPVQRRDLLATLDRYPDSATRELREAICRLNRREPPPGFRPLRGGWSLRLDP